jgi:fatty acid desaturase
MDLKARRLRTILSWGGACCACVVLYAHVWDGSPPPAFVVSICTLVLVGCGAGLSSLQGKGLLSAYKERLSIAERDELDRINKRSWPGFWGMLAALAAMVVARSLHDHMTPYYRPTIVVLAVVTALLAAGQFSLKCAERRLYDRVLPEDAA